MGSPTITPPIYRPLYSAEGGAPAGFRCELCAAKRFYAATEEDMLKHLKAKHGVRPQMEFDFFNGERI